MLILHSLLSPGVEIGRQATLRWWCWKRRAGSNPVSGTRKKFCKKCRTFFMRTAKAFHVVWGLKFVATRTCSREQTNLKTQSPQAIKDFEYLHQDGRKKKALLAKQVRTFYLGKTSHIGSANAVS